MAYSVNFGTKSGTKKRPQGVGGANNPYWKDESHGQGDGGTSGNSSFGYVAYDNGASGLNGTGNRVVYPSTVTPRGPVKPGLPPLPENQPDPPADNGGGGGGGGGGGAAPAETPAEQAAALGRSDVAVGLPGAFQGPQAQTGAWNPQTGMYEAWNPQTGMYESYKAGDVIGNYDPATDAAYQRAMQALRDAQAKLPQFANSYGDELQSIYDQIRGRDPFRYDLDADMLYQQYRQQYINQGQQAMRDTMGQAAGLTGGYGSTYAQNAGQQAYNSYLQQLNDRIPELEERALQRWQAEGDRLKDQYTLARDMSNNEYQQFRDSIADYWNNLGFLDSQAQQAYQRGSDFWSRANTLNNEAENRAYQEWTTAAQANQDAYNREADAWNRGYQQNQDAYNRELQAHQIGTQADDTAWQRAVQEYRLGLANNETAYSRQQDAQAQLLQLMQLGYTPTDEDLMAAGMTTDQANAWKNYIAAQNAPKGGGGGGGGDDGSENRLSSFGRSMIPQMQQMLKDGQYSDAAMGRVVDYIDKRVSNGQISPEEGEYIKRWLAENE